MDVTTIPADTCPLCQQRALRWEGGTCVCRSCGSKFVADPRTRRCQYTYVAPDYAALTPSLTQDWLTRREVFERAQQTETPVAESAIAQGAPETGPVNQAPDMEPAQSSLAYESPSPDVPRAAGTRSSRPTVPLTAVWAVLIGTLALIPILCACLSALLLGKDISRTREMIAAANQPSVVISSTLVGQITSTIGITDQINPLESPLLTPTQKATSLAEGVSATIGAGELPTPVTLIAATSQNPMPTPLPPTLMFQSPLPTPQLQPGAPTATLPPTFTALPASSLTTTATPEPTATQGTPTPTGTAAVSGTVTPTPTPTSNATYTGSVRITMVMYTGTASLNMSDQYVEVANVSNTQVNIGNWTITAASDNKSFMFYNGLVLQAGQTCRVYTSSPPQTTGGCGALSFNNMNSTGVWSTTKDTARLYDQNGALMSSYSYP